MNTPSGTTRRDFLKRSAALAAGTALAGGLSIARSAHAAGSDQLKACLIGCGGRGQGAIRNLLDAGPGIKLVAVADAFERLARGAVQGLKGEGAYKERTDVPEDRIFWGLDAYQKALATGVDIAVLAAPPGFRPAHYQAAVQAGKHVFMEKPCCVDAPGFRSLMETNKLADQKGLLVGVGLQRRHEPPYIETIKRIHDGAIGQLIYQRVYWNGAGVWVRPREPGQTEMQYQVHNWYYFVWLSGDHICEQHVHNLDIANWVFDKQGDPANAHPIEANGMGGRQVRKGKDVGHIYDHHFVEFTYPDGSKLFSQCRHIPNTWSAVMEHAVGTEGDSNCCGQIGGQNPWSYQGPRPNGWQQEHNDLVAALRAGKRYNEGWYGAVASFTAVLGRMATYSGQVVKWDEAVQKGPDEMPKQLRWDADPPVLPGPDGGYEHAVAVPGLYKPY